MLPRLLALLALDRRPRLSRPARALRTAVGGGAAAGGRRWRGGGRLAPGLWVVLLGLLLALPAWAQAPATPPAPPPDPFLERVKPVLAPGAACLAVSDALGLLVVGQRGQPHHLSVFTLDAAEGVKAGEGQPATVTIAKSAALAQFPSNPLDLVFHPTLPLLYVWQDIAGPNVADPKANPVFNEFDHLLVFAVKEGKLEPLAAFARGEQYAYGQSLASLGIDPAGKRLFLSNLRDPANGNAALGYLDLDDKGLPIPTPVAVAGSLDGRGLEEFDSKVTPTMVVGQALRALPNGWGFFAASPRYLTFGGPHGVGVWDTENRRGALSNVYIANVAVNALLAADPQRPALYGASHGGASVFRIAHARGIPTLLPQVFALPAGSLQSPPLVMPGKPGPGRVLVVGAVSSIVAIPLDEQGGFTGGSQAYPMENPAVRALGYSAKVDRLFVPVEKLP